MSRLLAELLGAPEPAFSLTLRRLEQTSGRPSADVRLTADILSKSNGALRELGFDPSDTTARELYHALMLKSEQDEKQLRKHLKIKDQAKLNKIIPAVVKSLSQLNLPRSAWVMKNSVAKRLILANPPKHLMKHLGYRSVDSLLKRELPAAIIAGALMSEGSSWRERFHSKYRQLKVTDCETRDISVVILEEKRWQKFFIHYPALKRQLIMPIPELGALVVLPMEAVVLPGAALALLLSFVYHMNNVRSLSAQVKMQQVKPQFGAHALAIWSGRAKPMAALADQPVYWSVIHRHFANRSVEDYPELFNPHVQPEDLIQASPASVLANIDPAFGFWQRAEQCGVSKYTQPVSLNALDVAFNYCNQLAFPRRSLAFMQEALGQKLLLRYIRQPRLMQQLLDQLESEPSLVFQTQVMA